MSLIIIIIILLIISSLLSINNQPIIYDNFNNINCHRTENQAITYENDPLKFIKNGRYKIRGYTIPSIKSPNGLISIGTAKCEQIGNNGKKIVSNTNFYDRKTNKFVYNARNTTEYLIDPYGRIYTWRYTFSNNKLVSTRNGVATDITPNRIIFDVQGSLFKTEQFYENIKIILQKLSENKYKLSIYVHDSDLLDEKIFTFIGK